MFTQAPSEMPGNGKDTRVVFHRLTIDSLIKPASQGKHKVDKENRIEIDEEV